MDCMLFAVMECGGGGFQVSLRIDDRWSGSIRECE